ncbi:MAG TPA: carbohydrate porin, partial [Polyangiaceae bacterium]|nr:carbohydrate porin [Polyangiaceae bacterium]
AAAPAPAAAPVPVPVPVPVPPAKLQIDEYMAEAYENDTETRSRAIKQQRRAMADRFEHVLGNFVDIGGYFRAGYGRDSRGGALTAFAAPGAATKYRLGNEAENYGELIFGKNVYLPGAFRVNEDLRPDGTPSGPIARVQIRLSAFSPYATLANGSATTFGLPEAWASIGNVSAALPGAKFWAGRRFYRRHDIHVLDFFYWDMSGGGGGIEDLQIGRVKLALAWIGFGSTSGLGNVPVPDPANSAGFSKSTYDLRAYDVPLLGGTVEVGVSLATLRSGRDQAGRTAPTTSGVGLNLVHTIAGFINPEGTNKFSIQYGTGPAKTFTAGFETVDLPEGNFIRSVQKGSWRLRVTEHFIASLGEHFSLSPVVVFQATDQGDGTGRQYWYSAGVRPTAHFNRYFSLAADGGVDYVRDTGAKTSAALGKLTLAPQVAVGNRFDSRPVIRAFATAAWWGEDFRGRVGGADYANSLFGFNAGMQMEAWW